MGLKALHGPGSGENLHGAFKKSEKNILLCMSMFPFNYKAEGPHYFTTNKGLQLFKTPEYLLRIYLLK